MPINKVEYGGQVLMDLTQDTITPEVLLDGETAHDASGTPIKGSLKLKTINGESIIGSGDIKIDGGGQDVGLSIVNGLICCTWEEE